MGAILVIARAGHVMGGATVVNCTYSAGGWGLRSVAESRHLLLGCLSVRLRMGVWERWLIRIAKVIAGSLTSLSFDHGPAFTYGRKYILSAPASQSIRFILLRSNASSQSWPPKIKTGSFSSKGFRL
jgi:hypothetical protein